MIAFSVERLVGQGRGWQGLWRVGCGRWGGGSPESSRAGRVMHER